ncbi:MAG: hypothetical protein JRM89_03145 [Nitrososphaerota archaeon]|nr:hypothetical protein [Nitrososphaerota archaeon]WGO50925.1 MAG: hypothetical protein JRM93_02610 [Nitrososphaerota archaeon]
MKLARALPTSVALAASLACALLVFAPLPSHAPSSAKVQAVPTRVCSCFPLGPGSGGGTPRFGIRGPPIYHNYDEQLGVTFTQSFPSIEYNVTALEQTDPALSTGPAYLVNGLSDTGYWYQVGVSWNWAPGDTPGTGLDMSYEVFDTHGSSIFPTNGQGGLLAFSGPVNPGDVVTLHLYFSNSTGDVVMLARDVNTGASASEAYPAMGASYFVGLPGSVANSNGFFTGLMTEWYHGLRYFANEAPIAYTDAGAGVTSAWMWMDEFNASNFQPVFASNTTAPVSFSGASRLQEFSFNGTTEYADASELVTGAISDPAAVSSGVPLVLSYGVRGSGAGASPPVLNYTFGGKAESTTLTAEPTLYFPQNGTGWSVSPELLGSNSTQRWATDQATAGVSAQPASSALAYYEQARVTFGFTVDGGGSGFSPPHIGYSLFGRAATAPVGEGVWADSGSRYQYQNPLPGSTGGERWYTASGGVIGRAGSISATYYRQYFVTFDVGFRDTGIIPALSVRSTFAGSSYTAGVVGGPNGVWLDSGAAYYFPQSFAIGPGQRFLLNGTSTGAVTGSSSVAVVYEHQFYVQVEGTAAGGAVTPGTGWYDSGTVLSLEAVPSQGWQFEGWQGAGTDSVSGSQTGLSMTVGPGAPSNETAVFYPGVKVQANGPSPVSYRDGQVSGSVAAGAEKVVYVPAGSLLTLTGSSVPFWTSFTGWQGASNSTSMSAGVVVDGPLAVTGSSAYDLLGVASALLVLALAVSGAAVLWRRRRARKRLYLTAPSGA